MRTQLHLLYEKMAPVKPINTRSTSTRKKISKVRFLNNLYSSPTSKNVKKYLEHHLAEVAEKQNLTDQGAETVTLKYVFSVRIQSVISDRSVI